MKQTVHIGHRAIARRVVALYFLVAAGWIVASDLAMLLWVPESVSMTAGSMAKGVLFVLVTSFALYQVLHRVARMESQPAPVADAGRRALRESEQRFRAVVEQSIAAVYVIQDGKLIYANPRMREIFGYGPDEPFDPDPMAHIAPHEYARVAEQIVRRMHEEPEAAYSVAAQHRDGTPFTLGVHAKQASFDGRPAIIAVAQDITEKVRAEEDIKRYIERLEQSMKSTINVVAKIGELRDPYTHGHERRVGEIAAAIAAEIGLDTNEVEGIRIAGYLHDIGKIGVPAEILAKPTRLTQKEFELVKDHAHTSYEILRDVEFPWPVAEAAWQHHERLDGSGYPCGLKGEEIILEARILAVADTVEAMSSHRPYRPALGIDAALEEIEKSRGKLYDPQAADACLRLFREKGYRLPA